MIKILNTILSYLKVLLLLVSFVFSFFIIINMYQRLEKNMINAIFNFIPFILFAINIIFKQKSVNNCLFYNVTCCLVFLMLLFSVYRTFCDKNMIAIIRLGYNINFNYFADVIAPMKAMLYILSVSNVLLMLEDFHFVPKKVEVVTKTDTKKKIIKGKNNGVNVVEFSDPDKKKSK